MGGEGRGKSSNFPGRFMYAKKTGFTCYAGFFKQTTASNCIM